MQARRTFFQVIRGSAALVTLWAGLLSPAHAIDPNGLTKAQQQALQRDGAMGVNDLWHVMNLTCLPGAALGITGPCAKVDTENGYVWLPVGRGHILTIPTTKMTGIESDELLHPSARNYWQDAWEARAEIAKRLGRPLDRSDVGLAINSIIGRSQDQMHIHTACVRADVKYLLNRQAASIGKSWQNFPQALAGQRYQVRRVDGADLTGTNVFAMHPPEILADAQRRSMQTLVVVGMRFSGQDGFVVLRDEARPGDPASGERLLDPSCRSAT